jgi:hypothetical protein
MIGELEEQVRGKDCELQDLEELILQKDRVIASLNEDLLSAEDQRRRD